MKRWLRENNPMAPKGIKKTVSPGQGGIVWRTLVTAVLGVIGSVLVTMTIFSPTKRNIEVLAAAIFMGFVLVAHPFKAYLFTLAVLPFPANTTVGTTSTLLIFAMAGLTMVKSRFHQLDSPFFNRGADLAIMGWMIMLFISLYSLPSAYYPDARYVLLGFVSGVMLYYATIQLVNSPEKLLTTIKTMQVVASLLALLGVLQFLFPEKQFLPAFFDFSKTIASREDIRAGTIRSYATFSGYELFAEYMAICSIFQFVLARIARTAREKGFWICTSILVLMALFATGTRAGILILVGGYSYMFVVGGRVIPRKNLLSVFFVVFAMFYISMAFTTRFTDTMFSRMEDLGVNDSSVGSRTIVLQEAIEGIGEQPFLGHGPIIPPKTFHGPVGSNVHNLYVHLAYTIGLPGLLIFLWFLWLLWRESRKSMMTPGLPRNLAELTVALHVAITMFIVDQMKIEYTRDSLTIHMAWFLFGLIMATRHILTKPGASWGMDRGQGGGAVRRW